ncbi:MAG TPA: molybdopterin-dependent oxidoreductase, partial [Candidatus Lokiarchaeia archaeon]|nr:molybdopterin-dependent oxidoreductase [Candidatus Lokiarchaeia archaeon]
DPISVDPTRLPPRQHARRSIMRWGIDHPPIVPVLPTVDRDSWQLTVDGLVEHPMTFSWEDFVALPLVESASDFHCVETWSIFDQQWEGLPFNKLVDMVHPYPEALYVFFESADGYTTSLTVEELSADENLLAIKVNGEMLDQGYGGPLRLVVPQKYAYKSAMYVTHITFMATKELGYWEKRGYSDTADVWTDDRFSRRRGGY